MNYKIKFGDNRTFNIFSLMYTTIYLLLTIPHIRRLSWEDSYLVSKDVLQHDGWMDTILVGAVMYIIYLVYISFRMILRIKSIEVVELLKSAAIAIFCYLVIFSALYFYMQMISTHKAIIEFRDYQHTLEEEETCRCESKKMGLIELFKKRYHENKSFNMNLDTPSLECNFIHSYVNPEENMVMNGKIFYPYKYALIPSENLMKDYIYRSIHLSIITFTTVGYGDITPNSNSALIVVDLQALVSIIFSLLIISLLISKFNSPTVFH